MKQLAATLVSIPFKRESGVKALTYLTKRAVGVSIPFKRESGVKDRAIKDSKGKPQEFQFPSNGKAESKSNYGKGIETHEKNVSIPFKRESGVKGCHYFGFGFVNICFNSLQTGKRSQRPKKEKVVKNLIRFNSLQTGKRSQRLSQSASGLSRLLDKCFNSLQTGKRSQS